MSSQQEGFVKSRLKAFGYAFSGWWFVIRTQRNAWIHMVVSVAVILMSFILRINAYSWALILLSISMVWIAEFLNTALEAVVDLATNHQHHDLARVGKDVGAAAVLIAAVSSIIIGLLILGPPLWAMIKSLF
ncbi:MAG: diacylglycerol kinase family protein [Anaerolineales bacterium]|jgi:diacylglycerol kinase